MVSLSDDAAALISRLVADSALPETAGLRLGTDDSTHALEMHLAPAPNPEDVVVEHDGAALFVSPLAADRTADQTLQAQVDGRPAFFVE